VNITGTVPPWILIDPLLHSWLLEDLGRGDRTTQGLFANWEVNEGEAKWIVKETGIIAGLPIAARVFTLLDQQVKFEAKVNEGQKCETGTVIATIKGPLNSLLMGERVALNLSMSLCGIATLTNKYVKAIADLPTKLVDTRKTTPGLRILEKYATHIGGAINHRMGLDDGVMIKDNHIQAAGGIGQAIKRIKKHIPYPLTIEVETSNQEEVFEALEYGADIIMLDNMNIPEMTRAVELIRGRSKRIKIEASGNVTLENIRQVAQTGVDYISSSAPITRAPWLDLSMKII
jgi:nicotinate-nucleotide pyrophosphorylase (carboxylating)